jgi:2-polyprenyl-6-methoxyphenol hydroxylase-like FAD-dependent oxidoreductase
MRKPTIAIIGAGPGGLTLACILQRHGLAATVFERDHDPAARTQGGSLDLHGESGQYALHEAGLSAAFKQIARYEDQQSRLYDKHATLWFADTDVSNKNRPEVDRGALRRILLDALPPGVVRWNHGLSAVREHEGGTAELVFADGTSACFDLVIGAYGAWSRIRPLLSPHQPLYSGVTFVELGIAEVDTRYPKLAQLMGRGLTFALGDSRALIGHRDAHAHLGVYAALRVPEAWARNGLDHSSIRALKHSLAAQFDGWSDALLQLIYCSDERLTPRAIHALPVGHGWAHRPGVTLLGDAAHLMSPFGGDGANLAMHDAADLAAALLYHDDWDKAVAHYETAMCERAQPAAAGARDGLAEAFAEDALEHMLQHLQAQRSGNGG